MPCSVNQVAEQLANQAAKHSVSFVETFPLHVLSFDSVCILLFQPSARVDGFTFYGAAYMFTFYQQLYILEALFILLCIYHLMNEYFFKK